MARGSWKAYPTDLSGDQWEFARIVLQDAKPGGRPRTTDLREVINAILYLNRSGCQWDMLPRDFPSKSTVYDYFVKWRDDGTWTLMLDVLREGYRSAKANSGASACKEIARGWCDSNGRIRINRARGETRL